MTKWISVKDALPKDENCVLVWIRWGETPAKASYKEGRGWLPNTEHYDCEGGWDGCVTIGDFSSKEVTHWMPLPEPPLDVDDDN